MHEVDVATYLSGAIHAGGCFCQFTGADRAANDRRVAGDSEESAS